ncbi:MAG TPA: dTDP-4-dehydrorhamnose 3,5-epimerase [Polyangiaceae bacterium]
METIEHELDGLKLVRPQLFKDDRGWFFEPYNEARYCQAGIVDRFVQDNLSCSTGGTLRGLHYQRSPGQAKLVSVVSGRILDVVVDIRPESKSFGRWVSVELDAETHTQIYVPVGFAHGFCVISDRAEVLYKVSSPYNAAEECTISWNDPEIGIAWPIASPVLSTRDQRGESFATYRRRVGR